MIRGKVTLYVKDQFQDYITNCNENLRLLHFLHASYVIIQELLQVHKCRMPSKETCGEGIP